MAQQGVSVIICTYNGAKRLPQTLRHLANQVIPQGLQWEVIVVDNNSTDNTFETVQTEWAGFNTNIAFTLVKQPKPGVSYAREMGIEISRYAYLIQCDDDNWLAPNYVATVATILDGNEKIGIVGGQSTGAYETEPPVWFNNFSTAYAIGQRRATDTPINWLATAGTGIRRQSLDALNAIGFKHILSGRQGKNLLAGDDLELCAALRAIGYEVYYTNGLAFIHYMTASRLTWQYLKKMVYGQNKAQVVFDMYCIVYGLLHGAKPVRFTVVYKILTQQVSAPLKKRCGGVRKAIRFTMSLFLNQEGNKYQFENKYYAKYFWYVLLHKREIHALYNAIMQFYGKVKRNKTVAA